MVSGASKAIVQAILFYIVWFLVVYWMKDGQLELFALGLQLLFVLIFLKKSEIRFLGSVTIIGSIVDSIPVALGLVTFPGTDLYIGLYPIWMLLMWSIFATTFSLSLGWLQGRIGLQSLFGLIGGSLSIYAAYGIGALDFPKGEALAVIFCSIEWGILVPILFSMHRRLQRA